MILRSLQPLRSNWTEAQIKTPIKPSLSGLNHQTLLKISIFFPLKEGEIMVLVEVVNGVYWMALNAHFVVEVRA